MSCTCYLPNSATLFDIDAERFGQAGALQRRSVAITVSDITRIGAQR